MTDFLWLKHAAAARKVILELRRRVPGGSPLCFVPSLGSNGGSICVLQPGCVAGMRVSQYSLEEA